MWSKKWIRSELKGAGWEGKSKGMSMPLPTYFLMVLFAGWLNRQQHAAIEYLRAENEILKSQLKNRRLRLTDEERRLAMKGRALGRKLLAECANFVTPETILAWHRKLVARKWTFRRRTIGRPSISQDVRALIVEMASNDSNWDIEVSETGSAISGHQVSRATVGSVLREHGIEPAPKRRKGMSWNVLESALAPIGGHRLHDRRGLDERRLGDSLRCIRHGTGNEESDTCWAVRRQLSTVRTSAKPGRKVQARIWDERSAPRQVRARAGQVECNLRLVWGPEPRSMCCWRNLRSIRDRWPCMLTPARGCHELEPRKFRSMRQAKASQWRPARERRGARNRVRGGESVRPGRRIAPPPNVGVRERNRVWRDRV